MSLATTADAYYCNAQKPCTREGFTCKDNKYCTAEVTPASCATPFVARISNVYTQFCNVPDTLAAEVTDASGCASFESYHQGVCLLKEPTTNIVAKTVDSYFCSATKSCPIAGHTCKDNKYCVSEVEATSDCDKQAFVARVNDVYTKFCKVPEVLNAQAVDASACASWETFHHGVCLLNNATPQTATSMSAYFCNSSKSCPLPGYSCHYSKYCLPEMSTNSACASESAKPFVARINDTYTYFCDIPNSLDQYAASSIDCANWEDYHSGICMLKKCSQSQAACINGDNEMCSMLGVQSANINCYGHNAHGGIMEAKSAGLSGGKIAGITIGSIAGVALLGAAAFFAFRRSKKNKKANVTPGAPSMETLPNYSSGNVHVVVDEKARI
ncbi:hypothetical protein K7432_005633 [Basidiobolus ranarum]|uniref:Uncharacterized protein n=1 Tax=Basidiobolus ranarum TaxID=34480 RepID=A0ABR2WWC0_9FUNG